MTRVASLAFVPPIVVAAAYGEWKPLLWFSVSAVLTYAVGEVGVRAFKPRLRTRPRHAIVAVSYLWLLVPLFSAIPFHYCEGMSWLDSYFEAISGWTTTGLTVMPDIDHAYKSILFWRSLMQWIGGLGIVVSMIAVLRFETPSMLYVAEAREERIKPNVVNTAKEMWKIYIVITAVGAVALWAAGMSPFDAVNHSMTAVATGGFSTKSASIGAWHSLTIEAITVALMVLGATNFVTHYKAAKSIKTHPKGPLAGVLSGVKWYLRDRQFMMLVGLVVAITLYGVLTSAGNPMSAAHYYGYQAVSAITCCGFSDTDVGKFPDHVKFGLTILMIVGGSTASTAGAIKILRFLIMAEAVKVSVAKRVLPVRGVLVPKLGDRVLKKEEIFDAFSIAGAYVFFVTIGALLLSAFGYPLVDSLFEVASAQGGVGLSTGITSPSAPAAVKALLIFHMWIGRLEVLPCLAAMYWTVEILARALRGK